MKGVSFCYSRKQAFEDGVLIDVSALAAEEGFSFPVAVTSSAWSACVHVPEAVANWQTEKGRLRDILSLLRLEDGILPSDYLQMQVVVQNNPIGPLEMVTLIAWCDGLDVGEPAVTIVLP